MKTTAKKRIAGKVNRTKNNGESKNSQRYLEGDIDEQRNPQQIDVLVVWDDLVSYIFLGRRSPWANAPALRRTFPRSPKAIVGECLG